jgi:hypothetical protein
VQRPPVDFAALRAMDALWLALVSQLGG